MEEKSGTRSRSACRLAVQGNPGRVRYVFQITNQKFLRAFSSYLVTCCCFRWLIGDEKYWRYTLKVLVGVPIILMCALLIAIALPHAATAKRTARSNRELSELNKIFCIPLIKTKPSQNLQDRYFCKNSVTSNKFRTHPIRTTLVTLLATQNLAKTKISRSLCVSFRFLVLISAVVGKQVQYHFDFFLKINYCSSTRLPLQRSTGP